MRRGVSGRSGCWKSGTLSDHSGPRSDVVEISSLGPGYGESVLVHSGAEEWLVVDSCLSTDGEPAASNYLRGMDVDLSTAVKMVVATLWHDDHILKMARLLAACTSVHFCCASALKTDEFLGVAAGLTKSAYSQFRPGVREAHHRRLPIYHGQARPRVPGGRVMAEETLSAACKHRRASTACSPYTRNSELRRLPD